MLRFTKEEWERRKTYLIRSLFEDLPILSPINESQEPAPSSPNDSNIYRPESPLPDLIIEREPPKHDEDEDEEFYDKLAREMRRRYRKDFLNEDTKSSTDVSTEVVDKIIEEESISEENGSLEAEIQDFGEEQVLIDAEIQDFDEEQIYTEDEIQEENVEEEHAAEISREEEEQSELSSTSTDSSDTEESYEQIISKAESTASSDSEEMYEQITTIAEVYTEHKSSERLLERTQSSEKATTRLDSRSKSTEIEVLSFSSEEKERSEDIENRDVEIKATGSEELTTPTEASTESSHPQGSGEYHQRTPEIMRRQTLVSQTSLPLHEIPMNDSNEIIISKSMAMDNTVVTENLTDLAFEMDIASSNSDSMHYTATSTPKSSKIKTRMKRHNNRLVPYSPSSRGSTSKDTTCVALQTSFSSDHEPEWKELWTNFFIGTPIVYNLCSCKNHVCT